MDQYTIEGHEVHTGTAKPTGNGAYVLVPKRWLGADVKVIRTSESDDDDGEPE